MITSPDTSTKEMDKYVTGLKDALAVSRQSVAKVHDALNTTYGQPSSLAELKELLEELQQQPILLRVRTCLCRFSLVCLLDLACATHLRVSPFLLSPCVSPSLYHRRSPRWRTSLPRQRPGRQRRRS